MTTIKTKVVQVSAFAFILAVGVTIFFANRNYLFAFKPYYVQSYRYAAQIVLNSMTTAKAASSESESRRARSIPVITYHGIISDQPDGSNVSLNSFTTQMIALKKDGWQTVTMSEYYDFIYNSKDLPEKSFLLTFDDGRKDAYYPADPILRALGYHAVMFVITGESFKSPGTYYLSKEELVRMRDSGYWDLEVHTSDGHAAQKIDAIKYGHFYANKLWLEDSHRLETDQEYEERIRIDLEKGKSDLKRELGIEATSIAIPFGDVATGETNYPGSKDVLLRLIRENYKLCFYQFWPGRGYGANYSGSQELFSNRISVEPNWTLEDYFKIINQGQAKTLPFSDSFDTNKGWLNAWGSSFYNGQGLLLRPTNILVSANTYLDGAWDWQNYQVSYKAILSEGTSLKQQLRRYDSNDYVSCTYGPEYVSLEIIRGGQNTILATATKTPGIDYKSGVDLSGRVMGATAACSIGGVQVVSAPLPNESPKNGGIAFESWGKTAENYLEISDLKVEELNGY